MKCKLLCVVTLVTCVVCSLASADPVAYWRFEEGPDVTNVPHTVADGQFESAVPDMTSNGNDLSAWSDGGCCGYAYRTDVPFASVPLTSAANNFSVKNTGGGPGMFTDSSVSLPSGVDIETMMPLAWTVEASFKPENGGYRTVVGRDSSGVVSSDGALAALYFQVQPDDSMAIKFSDVAGNFWEAVSAPGVIQGFDFGSDPDGTTGTWYNVAGVSDGSTLKLYIDGSLQATTPIVSADARLTFGGPGGGDWHPGEWSVGRGMHNGGHVDRAYGYIDEVRISNSALMPTEFLVPPAPSELSLEVNKVTGEVTLTNLAGTPVSLDFYRIASDAGALSLSGWDSLDNQNYDAVDGPDDPDSIAGNSKGEGWDEAGGSNTMQLIELFLRESASSIGAGATLNLGNAYDPSIFSGADGDLEFTYSLTGGVPRTADVSYVTGGLLGDFNSNGGVENADLTLLLNNWAVPVPPTPAGWLGNPLTAPAVDNDELTALLNNWGATVGAGSTSNATVPEPTGWIALFVAAAALVVCRPTQWGGR